jgi:predicted GNAT superfamily acetyltransferase
MYIRSIQTRDHVEILGINAESTPGVSHLDGDELRRIASIASITCIASESGLISGYLFAFADSDPYDGEEFRRFLTDLDRPFIYVDQLAVRAMYRHMGVASALYENLAQRSKEMNIYTLCCEVNLRPLNIASLQFHERRRFQKLGEMETSDGRLVALLHKELSRGLS